MFVDTLVGAIVERLAETLPDLQVEPFPDAPEDYQLYHPVGAALVLYGGSKYGAPEGTGALLQERRAEIDIALLIRNLRGPAGANNHLDAIRLALAGWWPEGLGRSAALRPTADRFVSHDNGVWRFEISFTCAYPVVEADDEAAAPLLRRLTLADPAGPDLEVSHG